jgi:hypothetical protein
MPLAGGEEASLRGRCVAHRLQDLFYAVALQAALRVLEDIRADVRALKKEPEALNDRS